MRAFQAAYIGRHEFPKNLSEFELRQLQHQDQDVLRSEPQVTTGRLLVRRSAGRVAAA